MRAAKRIGAGVLVVLLIAFIALATWEPLTAKTASLPSARAYDAEIRRDEFGVPHIYGKTDADVAYGVAIAHAEDGLHRLAHQLVEALGVVPPVIQCVCVCVCVLWLCVVVCAVMCVL